METIIALSKRLIFGLVALLFASPSLASPLQAQGVQHDPLLDHLIGDWVLRGPMAGKDVVHDVSFRWVLGGEYVEMHEISRERTAAGTPVYEAIVYLVHDPHDHEYAALWLDNTDYNAFYAAGVGHATARGDSIPFVFTASRTDHFHNTFVYDRARDAWAWHMDNDDTHGRRPFARVTLVRAKSSAADSSGQDLAAARAAIAPQLQEMLAAANAHDTDRHLASYQRSPDLVFVVNDQVIHGWDALRAQQLKWWQNGKSDAVYAVLGKPEYTMLAPGLVAQTYFLDSHRAGDDAHGAHLGVTDVWRKQGGTWRIVYAHESVAPR